MAEGNGTEKNNGSEKPIEGERKPINFEMNVAPYPTSGTPTPSAPTPSLEATADDDPRTSKQVALDEAIRRYVPDNIESLAIGGMHMHNNPMALIRELVRQKKRIKRLITSPAACLNADLLIGAGLVEEVVTPYIGFEHLGLAPAFRRMAQEGRLKVLEVDELTLLAGLRAGAANQPFISLPPGLEFSDITRHNTDFYRLSTDPFTGREVLVAPAIRPQFAFICAQQADKAGNASFRGASFADREMAFAAQTTLLQVEGVVPAGMLSTNPLLVTLPGYYITAVVPASFGCHPTSSHRYYHYDENHLKEYLKLAATEDGFQQYLEKYVLVTNETDYLGKTTVAEW